ncbi:MAG: hypothetical protein GWN61_15500, partial [candidate division Zixibacteria bacterium]|nr:hypothetical protein [Phycisphaerae bacterium]NIQ74933.1 hypothetical protein [Gammaproteobacteria bacterium]NIR65640.1 hypothetical protein [candidate division Zixibacteria bacterium]NIU15448.1 hypothetical protein [candidate division Zixibacteria bacterium]NIV07537.1 hypothetical protein [candidate division Zixibacteria bacterium]
KVNGILYFTADDGTYGLELWKTDGTVAGTVMVKNIWAGNSHSAPQSLTVVNNTLFFSANDGVNGRELWKSDGTVAGTVMVKDILPGIIGSDPTDLTKVNNTLFFSASNGTSGYELWKSDGTEAGTVMVKDVYPGGNGSYPQSMTDVNGVLYFYASVPPGALGLCKSDGTEAGTICIKSFPTSPLGSPPLTIAEANGEVFFTANIAESGQAPEYELWKTDGTETGTFLVADLREPSATEEGVSYGSMEHGFIYVGNRVYFTPVTQSVGSELFSVRNYISVSNISVVEGDSGTTTANFKVRLLMKEAGDVSVDYATVDGTATAGTDYISTSGTLTFPPGTTELTVSVPVEGDLIYEGDDETFSLVLSNVSASSEVLLLNDSAVATILENDPQPVVSVGPASIEEGNWGYKNMNFPVSLSSPSAVTVSLSVYTSDMSANGGSDYESIPNSSIEIAPGETSV